MSLLALIVVLVILAGALWLVNVKGAAMNPTIKLIINIVIIAVAIILVLAAFGIWDQIRNVQVPKL